MLSDEQKIAFKESMRKYEYNLLLGAGISMDSTNGLSNRLKSGSELKAHICAMLNESESASLSSLWMALTDEEKTEIINQFSDCTPGESVADIFHFSWHQIFTFNIDNVLETQYKRMKAPFQQLEVLNFCDEYRSRENETLVQLIHLHGYTERPEDGFVFSHTEYSQMLHTPNPWIHILSNLIATEPFIIAGTSLSEPDLEYYLSARTPTFSRKSTGPSFLVEPYPTRITNATCERLNLVLIKSTIKEFLAWVKKEIGQNPIRILPSPALTDFFIPSVSKIEREAFFANFRRIEPQHFLAGTENSGFFYGQKPEWSDIHKNNDIVRKDTDEVVNIIHGMLAAKFMKTQNALCIYSNAGTGKSTTLMRVASVFIKENIPVLAIKTENRLQVEKLQRQIGSINNQIILLVDGLADHVHQIRDLLLLTETHKNVIVLAAERKYRKAHIDNVFPIDTIIEYDLHDLSKLEYRDLIAKYRQQALIGDKNALHAPEYFADQLVGEPLALAICRIMNDFTPFDKLLESLWSDTVREIKLGYLCVALSDLCCQRGVRYFILQAMLGREFYVPTLFRDNIPLRCSRNPEFPNFVIPINPLIGDKILDLAARVDQDLMFQAFIRLAQAIAPYISRQAIKQRSSEYLTSRSLLDYDLYVKDLLGKSAEAFYTEIKQYYGWNSRYWEQLALFYCENDIDKAIQYAKYAVTLEKHSFPLATLAKIYFRAMVQKENSLEHYFQLGLESICDALTQEHRGRGISFTPFRTFLIGIEQFIRKGGILNHDQKYAIDIHFELGRKIFSRDAGIMEPMKRVDSLLEIIAQ